MITISIANHKGGVGKTATTHALGASLAQLGYKVLLVDIDPQSSLTNACGVDAPGESIAEVMGDGNAGNTPLSSVLIDVAESNGTTLHLAPGDIQLSLNETGIFQRLGRESILRDELATVAHDYDVCLIDCPPSLGILTINALAASTAVIIPTQPQISDLRGLKLFLDSITRMQRRINPTLEIMGILPTFVDSRLVHHKDALDVLNGQGLPLFKTSIGRSVRVAESPATGESIVNYDPNNPQAHNYKQLANEVDVWLKSAAR